VAISDTPLVPGSQNPTYPITPPNSPPSKEVSDIEPKSASGPSDGDGCGCYGDSGGGIGNPERDYFYYFYYYSASNVSEMHFCSRAQCPEDKDWTKGYGLVPYCGNGVGNGKGLSGWILDYHAKVHDGEGNFTGWNFQQHSESIQWKCVAETTRIPTEDFNGCNYNNPDGRKTLQFYTKGGHDRHYDNAGPDGRPHVVIYGNRFNGYWENMGQPELYRYRKQEVYADWKPKITSAGSVKPSGYWVKDDILTSITYKCMNCDDEDILFPAKTEGFNYSMPVAENQIEELAELRESCRKLDGGLETEYKACLYWYRCKSSAGWKWIPKPGGDKDHPKPGEPEVPPGTWVDTGLTCIETSTKFNELNFGKKYTYRLERKSRSRLNVDEKVYIDYSGSSLLNGVDFGGPTTAIIEAGEYYVDIGITIFSNMIQSTQKLNVSARTSVSEKCNEVLRNIVPVDPTDRDKDRLPCCDYMSKDFVAWKDGIGVPALIPPYMRPKRRM